MEGAESLSISFQDRQKQLCLLSSHIQEQEKWLDSLLERLGWSREALSSKDHPPLVQCPLNKHHFVSRESLETHTLNCQYTALGINPKTEDMLPDGRPFYKTDIPCVEISAAIAKAIEMYAEPPKQGSQKQHSGPAQREFIDQSEVIVESHDTLVTQEYFSSLEDPQPSPKEVLAKESPTQIIRYVKSWRLVPRDFATLALSAINAATVKGWLFTHLPKQHTHSSAFGDEIWTVESIMQGLTPKPGVESITPNVLMNGIRPLLGLKSRQFVLELWQFLHISRLQREGGIPNSIVEELTPLPLTPSPANQPPPLRLAETIQAMARRESSVPLPPPLSLPMAHVPYLFSTEARRLTYDYVVEVGGAVPGESTTGLHGSSSSEAELKVRLSESDRQEKSYLVAMKEERDYKRRRQSYRAKNVHITRRTPAEVMRDIINARMEEIQAALQEQQEIGKWCVDTERGRSPVSDKCAEASSSERRRYKDHREKTERRARSPPRRLSHHERDRQGGARQESSRKRSKSPQGTDVTSSKSHDNAASSRRRDKGERKHRHRSRSRDRSKSREGDKHRRRSRSRSREHARHRHGSRTRTKSHSRSRSRSRERRKHHHKSKHSNS